MPNISINQNNNQNWFHPTKIFFGNSILSDIDSIIHSNYPNIHEILIVTGKNHLKSNIQFQKNIEKLNKYKIHFYTEIDPYPSPETVEKLSYEIKQKNISLIIAVGGGSVMDASKASSLLSQNTGKWIEYSKGDKEVKHKGIPVIAIPTTSGSSSEVTKFSTIWDWELKTSSGLNNPYLYPEIAIIDPDLTISMPANLAANSGWDALTSSFESYWSKDSNEITDMYALKSISLFFDNLESSVNDSTYESREKCALGATISGIGYSNSRPNLCHAIGTPLTLNWQIIHGQAVCISLPYFLPYIFNNLPENKQQTLLKTCNTTNIDSLVTKIKEMIKNCNLSVNLDNIGLSKDDINIIVSQTPKERLLPVPFELSPQKFEQIISTMYKN